MGPTLAKKEVPLCVDLDGTLIRSDLLWESLLLLVKQRPWALLAIPLWLSRGRGHLKREIAKRVRLDPAALPYRREFVDWLRAERSAGRRLVLATASDESLAQAVASHLGFFSDVIASCGGMNAKGVNKLAILEERYGDGFDYVGDSAADGVIWRRARRAITANAPARMVRELEGKGKLERSFVDRRRPWKAWRKALRLHQWSKNLLIFLPVITSHRIFDRIALEHSGLMFAAFCCCASALYLVNDLLDLQSDRIHPEKRERPFASGQLPILAGLLAAPLLLAASFAIALPLGKADEAILICYGCVSLSYSLWWKSRAPLDVFLLSGLYTIRIMAGGVATHIWLSGWLLSFSVFLFLSLAFTKRMAELRLLQNLRQEQSSGRGYLTADFLLITAFAVSSGFISSLVLTFYVNSDQVRLLYAQPLYLWLLFPGLLYWLCKLWMLAFRGDLHEDPVLYAIRDRSTYAIGLVSFVLLAIAKFDFPAKLLR